VRPVNLLPERYRPRTAGDSKSAYIALAVLGVFVAGIFGYVLAANKVTATNSQIAEAQQRITAAQSQSVTLQDFGDFAAIKQARLEAVKSLATSRLDWERVFRELAHVLPAGVWLTGFDGQTAADDVTTDATTGHTLVLKGCASDHKQIADVLVRLRELDVADDVELTKTVAAEEAASGGTTSTETGCGRFYSFEVTITISSLPAAPAADGTAETVPARLGGGG